MDREAVKIIQVYAALKYIMLCRSPKAKQHSNNHVEDYSYFLLHLCSAHPSLVHYESFIKNCEVTISSIF